MPIVSERAAGHELATRLLDRIKEVFGLSETELSALFGVSRPAVAKWRSAGIPMERIADVDRVTELAEYFHRKFIPLRIPQIVREPGYEDDRRSFLEIIREEGVLPVYADLAETFSYLP